MRSARRHASSKSTKMPCAAQHCRAVMLYLWRDLHIIECLRKPITAVEGHYREAGETAPRHGTQRRGGLRGEHERMRERFRKLAYLTAEIVGSPWAFLAGAGAVLLWG